METNVNNKFRTHIVDVKIVDDFLSRTMMLRGFFVVVVVVVVVVEPERTSFFILHNINHLTKCNLRLKSLISTAPARNNLHLATSRIHRLLGNRIIANQQKAFRNFEFG
jgi:hypothetical protein